MSINRVLISHVKTELNNFKMGDALYIFVNYEDQKSQKIYDNNMKSRSGQCQSFGIS